MNEEKDKAQAAEIGYAFQDLTGFAARVDLENRIVTALSTARREAREEAFRDAIELVSDIPIDNSVPNFTRASAFKAKAIAILNACTGETNERTVENEAAK